MNFNLKGQNEIFRTIKRTRVRTLHNTLIGGAARRLRTHIAGTILVRMQKELAHLATIPSNLSSFLLQAERRGIRVPHELKRGKS